MNYHKNLLAMVGFLLVAGCLALAQTVPGTNPQTGAPTGARTGAQTGATMGVHTGAEAADQTDAMSSSSDRTFMQKAAQGGMAEVELGQLAQENGQSQEVKDFGKRMVDDHSKAGDQLKQVASQEGVTLPNDLSAKDKATKQRLSQLHGEAFDKAYMNDMVSDHREDVAEFKHESSSGRDPQVKEWATQTLPTLEGHLKMAEQVDAKVGGKTGRSASGMSTQPQ
jgi:putative membrane protein